MDRRYRFQLPGACCGLKDQAVLPSIGWCERHRALLEAVLACPGTGHPLFNIHEIWLKAEAGRVVLLGLAADAAACGDY